MRTCVAVSKRPYNSPPEFCLTRWLPAAFEPLPRHLRPLENYSRPAGRRGKVLPTSRGGAMKRQLTLFVVFAISSTVGLAQGGRAAEHWVGAWSTAVVVATPVP